MASQEESKCIVCDKNAAIYKCPRCELTSCSLECVQIHKKELECSGIRDKTAYVSLKKFDNLNLLSDYRFLEDINRSIDNCRRNPQRRYTRYMQPLPKHLYRLKKAAEKRQICLQYLPQHFSRHQDNKSMLSYETQEIHWQIDFIFPQGEMLKISKQVNEKTKLSEILDLYLNSTTCPALYKDALRFYHGFGVADIEVLLKAERVKQPNSFYVLDLKSTINENLANRVIIENPTIYVIRRSYKVEYNILDDDDKSETPFDILHGKKSGFFGDFTPVGYFDELVKTERSETKGDTAMNSILNSAFELRGKSRDQIEEDDSEPEEKPSTNKLFLPSYDTLCNLHQ